MAGFVGPGRPVYWWQASLLVVETLIGRQMGEISGKLLKILECPVAHAPLVEVGDWLYSTDPETRRKYPIRDGIPIMLIDESEVAAVEEFERVMAEAETRDESNKE